MRREVARKSRSDGIGVLDGVTEVWAVGSLTDALGCEDDGFSVGAGCPSAVVASSACEVDSCNVSCRCLFAADSCWRGWIESAALVAVAEKYLAGSFVVGRGCRALHGLDGKRGRGGRLRRIEKVGFIAKLSIGEMAAQTRGTLAAAIPDQKIREILYSAELKQSRNRKQEQKQVLFCAASMLLTLTL